MVVEWKPQSTREAGDIVMAGQGVLPESKLVELADVVLERAQPRRSDDDIVIYKSVGVGLEDVALAGLAWQRVQAAAR